MILILSKRGDLHADQVEGLLRRRGARVCRFDPGDFPGEARIALEHGANRLRTVIRTATTTIDLAEVRVAWYRRPSVPRVSDRVRDPAMRSYVGLECHLFIEGVWESLDCAWLPGLQGDLRRADHKLKQLRLAHGLGFAIPATLLTNDAGEMMRFYEEQGGRLISKLPTPALFWGEPRVAVRYTQAVTRGDLGHWPMLRHAPMIFQRRIDKSVEVRVTVVGDRVFAAEIHSQTRSRTEVDCRTDFHQTPYAVHELPAAVADRCVALTRRLGLTFSTIDLILTPDGEYVFIELNPNGQYLWIETLTGLPISEAIVDLLVAHEDSHDDAARPQP